MRILAFIILNFGNRNTVRPAKKFSPFQMKTYLPAPTDLDVPKSVFFVIERRAAVRIMASRHRRESGIQISV